MQLLVNHNFGQDYFLEIRIKSDIEYIVICVWKLYNSMERYGLIVL
jgi:hypothetical protein